MTTELQILLTPCKKTPHLSENQHIPCYNWSVWEGSKYVPGCMCEEEKSNRRNNISEFLYWLESLGKSLCFVVSATPAA